MPSIVAEALLPAGVRPGWGPAAEGAAGSPGPGGDAGGPPHPAASTRPDCEQAAGAPRKGAVPSLGGLRARAGLRPAQPRPQGPRGATLEGVQAAGARCKAPALLTSSIC